MATTTTAANLLKRLYPKDGVVGQQNLESPALQKIAKSTKKYNAGGEGFFGAINDYGNESGGAITESEQFRTIDSENYQQYKVVPKINYSAIEVTGLAKASADENAEAFADLLVQEVEMAKKRLLKDKNRQFFGLGTGALASPAGNVASTATSCSVDSAQYLRANMVIDIMNGATKTVDSLRISRVDKQSNVVYFSTSFGAALITTDVIIKENIRDSAPSDGKERMGLRGIVDDSTDLTTFENINAATNDIWQSVRIDASSGNLTADLLQRLIDDVESLGGEEVDLLVMHRLQRRSYLDLVVPQKRYQDGAMDAGHSSLSFNGKELIVDFDCQADTVYALNKKRLQRYVVKELHMATIEDAPKFLPIANYDKYQAYWIEYDNLGTDKRNAHGKIIGLSTKSGIR